MKKDLKVLDGLVPVTSETVDDARGETIHKPVLINHPQLRSELSQSRSPFENADHLRVGVALMQEERFSQLTSQKHLEIIKVVTCIIVLIILVYDHAHRDHLCQ